MHIKMNMRTANAKRQTTNANNNNSATKMLLLIVLFSPIFHVTYLYLLSFGAELRAFTFYNTAVYTKSMRLINHFCSLCSVFILSTHQFSMPQYAMGCCRVFFFSHYLSLSFARFFPHCCFI